MAKFLAVPSRGVIFESTCQRLNKKRNKYSAATPPLRQLPLFRLAASELRAFKNDLLHVGDGRVEERLLA